MRVATATTVTGPIFVGLDYHTESVQVCVLDRDYNVVAQLGDGKAANGQVGSRRNQTRAQFTPGQFITPHAAIFLKSGDILVAEWLPIGRITLLRRA